MLAALAVWRAYPGASIWGVARRLKWGASEDDAQFYAECLVNTPPPPADILQRSMQEKCSLSREQGRLPFKKVIPEGTLLMEFFGLLIIAAAELHSRDFRKCGKFQRKKSKLCL